MRADVRITEAGRAGFRCPAPGLYRRRGWHLLAALDETSDLYGLNLTRRKAG